MRAQYILPGFSNPDNTTLIVADKAVRRIPITSTENEVIVPININTPRKALARISAVSPKSENQALITQREKPKSVLEIKLDTIKSLLRSVEPNKQEWLADLWIAMLKQEMQPVPKKLGLIIPKDIRSEDMSSLENSSNPYDKLVAAQKYYLLGQENKAFSILEQESKSNLVSIRAKVARLYIEFGSFNEGLKILQGLENFPDSLVQREVIKAYIKLENFEKALIFIQRMGQKDDFSSRKFAARAFESFPKTTDIDLRRKILEVAQRIDLDRKEYVKYPELREHERQGNIEINTILASALAKVFG